MLKDVSPRAEKRDPESAQALFEKGCGQGHSLSCYNLAVMYKNGDTGVPK